MKRFISKIFAVFLFVLGTLNLGAQDKYEVISKSNLNVRRSPSPTAEVLGALTSKELIDVVDFVGDWAEFMYKGEKAYVFSKFIAKRINNNKPELYTVVSFSRLNVRNRPSTDSQILGSLESDSKISVLDIIGQWARIPYNGTDGFVNINYIQKIDAEPSIGEESQGVIDKEIQQDTLIEPIATGNTKSFNFWESISIDFIPNVYCGFSTFISDKVSPKAVAGFGIDAAFQLVVKENIGFIPKNYFMEASLGYSMRGSAAFPMHYINVKILPFGHGCQLGDFFLNGKMGLYVGCPLSKIETHYNSFDSKADVGLMLAVGSEYKKIGVSISYEQGLTNVCSSKLRLKNTCVCVNVSYRLFSFK